jgi:hypothetical protein
MLGLAYLCLWFPAITDAWQVASHGHAAGVLTGRSPLYVLFMLLCLGPMALPLLWQSPAFSKTVKVVLTIAVVLIAVFVVLSMVVLGPLIEQILRSSSGLLQTGP